MSEIFNKIKKNMGTPSNQTNNRIIYERHRKFNNVKIDNIKISGSDIDETFISFTSGNQKILAIMEIPCTEKELKNISCELMNIGGVISAIHNHWISIKPIIYYIHWQMLIPNNKLNITTMKLSKLWASL